MHKILGLLMLMASFAVNAQTPLHTDLPLPYLEQTTPAPQNQPLVIFLHGSGSNEEDLFDIKDALPATYTFLSVRAPQMLEDGSYQWFRKKGEGAYDGETDDLQGSTQLILDFVVQAAEKYRTQADKVILVGFSQGAIMSYEVALTHPHAVRAIAALSGKVLPLLSENLKTDPRRESLAIFIGHGTADSRLPYADGTEAYSLLQGLSLKPEFHAYPGIGHTISGTEMQDLNAWMRRINQ